VRALLVLLLLAGLAAPVAWGGGFEAGPQWAFAGIAAAAGFAAIALDRRRALRLLRSAPILILLAIAVLAAVSAAWTSAGPGVAIRAGALAAAYATLALAVGAACLPLSRAGAAVAVAAGVAALCGLVAVALYSSAFAERIDGGWAPEGPFGYAPALALVQVCALPPLLTAMGRARLVVAAAAAAGAALAAGVLVLAVSRLSLALAAAVLGIALAAPGRTVRASRSLVVAAIALFACAAVVFHELLGGWTPRHAPGDSGRLAALVAVLVVAPVAWALLRRQASNTVLLVPPKVSRYGALAAAAAVIGIAVAAGLLSAGPLSARRYDVHGSLTHGRTELWRASYHAVLERPLQGYGAGSFLAATAERQSHRRRVTRFAHNLPLELGVELGLLGLGLGLALYAAVARTLWRARNSPAAWLLGPAVASFLLFNLVDWPWHLAGVGAVFAVALGGLLGAGTRVERFA